MPTVHLGCPIGVSTAEVEALGILIAQKIVSVTKIVVLTVKKVSFNNLGQNIEFSC